MAAGCIVLDGSVELARHNYLYRAFNKPPSAVEKVVHVSMHSTCLSNNASSSQLKRDLVPYCAYSGSLAQYEEP